MWGPWPQADVVVHTGSQVGRIRKLYAEYGITTNTVFASPKTYGLGTPENAQKLSRMHPRRCRALRTERVAWSIYSFWTSAGVEPGFERQQAIRSFLVWKFQTSCRCACYQ